MALTDADRLQIVAMALMRHSVVGGGGGTPAESLIKYDEKLMPGDFVSIDAGTGNIYGADITAGQSYIESSEYSASYTASKAFDDSSATWYSLGATDEYVGVDFSSGNSKIIGLISIKNYSGYGFKGFKVQASDNNSDYIDLYSATALDNTDVQYFEFTNVTAYRYYRIISEGAQYNTKIRIYEIEMMEKV